MTLQSLITEIDKHIAAGLTAADVTALQSLAGRIRAINSSGRPKKLRPCPQCGTLCGAREGRRHICPANN